MLAKKKKKDRALAWTELQNIKYNVTQKEIRKKDLSNEKNHFQTSNLNNNLLYTFPEHIISSSATAYYKDSQK